MVARKARTEGAEAPARTPKPKSTEGFAAYVERFKTEHPDKWDELKLCPLQHGLIDMAKLLD